MLAPIRRLLQKAYRLAVHPSTFSLGAACMLVWAYLNQETGIIELAALLLGATLVCTAALGERAVTRMQHHSTTALQCAVMNMLGTLMHGMHLSVVPYAMGLAFTHFWMMVLSTDDDRTSYRTSHTMAYVLMLEGLLPIAFHALDIGIPAWLITLVFVATYAWWRNAVWRSIGLTPMSTGQHLEYWPQLARTQDPAAFWNTLRKYAELHPNDSMQPQLVQAVGHLSLAQLLGYLKENAVDAPHTRTVEDCIADAVKMQVCNIEPRAQCIWAAFGDNDVLGAVRAIESLSEPRQSTESLELPCLA